MSTFGPLHRASNTALHKCVLNKNQPGNCYPTVAGQGIHSRRCIHTPSPPARKQAQTLKCCGSGQPRRWRGSSSAGHHRLRHTSLGSGACRQPRCWRRPSGRCSGRCWRTTCALWGTTTSSTPWTSSTRTTCRTTWCTPR